MLVELTQTSFNHALCNRLRYCFASIPTEIGEAPAEIQLQASSEIRFLFRGFARAMERILPPLNALLTPEDSLLCWRVGKSAPQGRYPNLSHCEQAIAAIVFDGEILQVSTSSSNSGDLDSDD